MKALIASLAAVALTGCAVYDGTPYGSAGVYYGGTPRYGYDGPYVVEGQVYGGHDRGPRPGWRERRGDRDHDGVPNRYDRDRDGDGVPNRFDAYPNDPRRR